jgi:hypothetical protein
MGRSSTLGWVRASPMIARLLRHFLSENHRSGVRHRIRALGRGGHRPSLLFSFNHPHDPLLRQVAAWIAYP